MGIFKVGAKCIIPEKTWGGELLISSKQLYNNVAGVSPWGALLTILLESQHTIQIRVERVSCWAAKQHWCLDMPLFRSWKKNQPLVWVHLEMYFKVVTQHSRQHARKWNCLKLANLELNFHPFGERHCCPCVTEWNGQRDGERGKIKNSSIGWRPGWKF